MKIAALLAVALVACGGSDDADSTFMPPDVPGLTDPTPIGTVASLGNLDDERADAANTVVEFAGKGYFGANGPNGYSLFATDGTPAGTHVVASRPSWQFAPTPLRAFRSTLMFSVSDAYLGTELWVSDGTDAGTQLLVDSVPGATSGFSFIYDATATTLYFAVGSPSGGRLWRTDGTPTGTSQVTDLDIDTNAASRGGRGIVLGNQFLFPAIASTSGSELWTTDGTAGGTHLVKDIYPGATGSQLGSLTALGTKAVFTANNGTSGAELWSTDGTAANTVLVKDINPGAGSSVSSFFVAHITYAGAVYFTATDGSTGFELWRTDGTAANTTLVKDIASGVAGSSPSSFAVLGTKLLFVADDGVHGREPFVTDGTNTTLLTDITTGTASSNVSLYATLGGRALFRATDPIAGYELWKTDGTSGGTARVVDLQPGTADGLDSNPSVAIGRAFFTGHTTAGAITYVSDGTAAGTVDLGPLAPNQDGSSVSGNGFETFPAGVLFSARDAMHGGELWILPTGATAPQLIKDINPGAADGVFTRPLAVGAKAFFLANDGIHGTELWVTDGTAANTTLVKDIAPGVTSCQCQLYAAHGDKVYFGATDGVAAYQLWVSDGTALGTKVISGTLTTFGVVGEYNGHVLFGGTDPNVAVGAGLYTVLDNGTLTRLTAQPNASVSYIGAVPGTVFATTSLGMFRTDGTVAGTVLATTTHFPYAWFGAGGKRGFIDGGSLYATGDGTDATTTLLGRLVANIVPPNVPVELGGAVYFMGGNGTDGRGLYRTDMTPAGTQLVRDVPFVALFGEHIVASGGLVVFVGGDPAHGFELWASDGTTEGTARVADVNPGPNDSSTTALFAVGTSDVYFNANDGTHGVEPWKFSH